MEYFAIITCKRRATLGKIKEYFLVFTSTALFLKMLPSLRDFHILACAVSSSQHCVYLGVWAIREQKIP